MNAILKQSTKFRDENHKDLIIHASPAPIDIPDWVTQTHAYLSGVSSGTIVELHPKEPGITVTPEQHAEYLALKAGADAAGTHIKALEAQVAELTEKLKAIEECEAEVPEVAGEPNGKPKAKGKAR